MPMVVGMFFVRLGGRCGSWRGCGRCLGILGMNVLFAIGVYVRRALVRGLFVMARCCG